MTELVLRFEDYPTDEVVTRLSPVSIDEYYAVADAYGDGEWEDRTAIQAMYAVFAPFLVSWTFAPPATAEGLRKIDAKLSFAIVRNWIRGVNEAPPPLLLTSSAGATSAETSPQPSPEPAGSETS